MSSLGARHHPYALTTRCDTRRTLVPWLRPRTLLPPRTISITPTLTPSTRRQQQQVDMPHGASCMRVPAINRRARSNTVGVPPLSGGSGGGSCPRPPRLSIPVEPPKVPRRPPSKGNKRETLADIAKRIPLQLMRAYFNYPLRTSAEVSCSKIAYYSLSVLIRAECDGPQWLALARDASSGREELARLRKTGGFAWRYGCKFDVSCPALYFMRL